MDFKSRLNLIRQALSGSPSEQSHASNSQVIINGVIINGSGGEGAFGPQESQTQARGASEFQAIVSSGSIDVEWRAGPPSIQVEAEPRLMAQIKTQIVNGALEIRTEGSFSAHAPMRVICQSERVSSVEAVGSGDVSLQGVSAPALSVSLRGSGNISVHGACEEFSAQVAGSGDIDASGLQCNSARLRVQGSGDITAQPSKSADCAVLGSGDITLMGEPQSIKQSAQGSGDIIIQRARGPKPRF